ncbi:MAG: histidinol-phosphatase, partial [Verrucomicrobiota bacterium]
MQLEPFHAFIRELAAASAEVILPYYGRREVGHELKADESPVTVADRRAEEVMRELIERRHPGHGIVGEEFGTVRADAEFVWVLDPIDGTKSFISAVPLFGTLIGLLHRGRPVLGCIHQPVLRQLVVGDGRTTTLNGVPVRVREGRRLEEASVLLTDPLHPARYQPGPGYEALSRRVQLVRTWGDCYGYLLVASGWADVMLDPVMNPWDLLPVVPVIEGAGGVITDWQGRPANHLGATSAVAAPPGVPSQVVAVLVGQAPKTRPTAT